MKAARSGVSGAQNPVTTFADAIKGAAGVFAATRHHRDELARTEGVGAVAAAAGGESGVAALYERLREQVAAGHPPAA